jgi:hypothetical protein
MRLPQLIVYFETSPALGLLKSSNAPFIIDFLDRQFKQAGRIAIPHSELLPALIEYRERTRETYPDRLPSRADVYITEWCSPDALWLRRFLEASRDEPLYQLTPHTEDLFVFLSRVLDRDLGFVGTESRLKLVIDTLTDLVVGSSDDPESRLTHLRGEHRRIQEEINRIESDGRVTAYQPAQIRERFATAVSMLRQLQGDFRAVEESFRDITSQVQQRQAHGREARGGILEFALDSEDVLKREDQGVSFYEFVRLILSPSQTERLEHVIRELRKLPELRAQEDGLEIVRGMLTLLQNEADKVMRTNQRLSATLRRLLDSHAHAERQRIAQVLNDIRSNAIALAADPPFGEVGIELQLEPEIESPFRRTFWSEAPQFQTTKLTEHPVDVDLRREAFLRLAGLHRLDWQQMRRRIREVSYAHPGATLAELVDVYPIEGGVIEVLGYLQIARDDGHNVNAASSQTLVVPPLADGMNPLMLTVPLVTFMSGRTHVDAS